MINQKRPFKLPIKEVSNPPPFIKLIGKAKTPEQLEKTLEQIKEYWYSRGLRDMAKMYEKVLSDDT
jgi:hypothetical protein